MSNLTKPVTSPEYPRCSKAEVLRRVRLGNTQLVVSSAALHRHLGEKRYQQFIETIVADDHPPLGFKPEVVEAFLALNLLKDRRYKP